MTLKGDAKSKGKLTRGLKNDVRNLVSFHASSQKSENCLLMCYFCRKCIMFDPKKYRGFMCCNTEE